ncbi:organophosphate reductase [Enterococcus termitis]|nr:organophosphate reductase [Enterococcus termitis]
MIVRWLVEQEIIVLAKSVNAERVAQNIDVFDFSLTAEDKEQISKLNVGESQFFSHSDPQMIKWMASRKIDI